MAQGFRVVRDDENTIFSESSLFIFGIFLADLARPSKSGKIQESQLRPELMLKDIHRNGYISDIDVRPLCNWPWIIYIINLKKKRQPFIFKNSTNIGS